jgi:Protein of unknown function (DUF1214)
MDKAKAGEKYVLTFPAGQLPPIRKGGFWSMYNLPQRALIHNPLERYEIGDRTPDLKRADDGSLSIYLQPESPGKDKESNWLPSPPAGPFFMSFGSICRSQPLKTGNGRHRSRRWRISSFARHRTRMTRSWRSLPIPGRKGRKGADMSRSQGPRRTPAPVQGTKSLRSSPLRGA